MNSFKIKEELTYKPWLISSGALQALQQCVADHEAGKLSELTVEDFYSLRDEMSIDEDGIAHISIKDLLLREIPKGYETLGFATSYNNLSNEIDAALEQGAKAILFNIDSGGGSVSGCIELAEKLAELTIPTASFMEGQACSAAYKLGCGADVVFTSKSAQIGNIGAVLSIPNYSGYYKAIGISFDVFTNEGADLKSTGYLDELTPTQKAFLQNEINEVGEDFKNHVAANRDIDPEAFRAGWYRGDDAVEMGLADVVGSKEDAINYLKNEITVEV